MRLELLPISLLKSCPFFWACPLVQEEAIPDRKLKYFSSKNPATSACFWRFLGSTGSTRNGAGAGCRARSYESRPPSGVRANGKQPATSPQLPPLLHPSSLVRPVRPEKPPHSPRLWEKAGKAGKEPRPSAGPKKWPSSTSSRTGRSSGPGNWLKGSFLRHILLSLLAWHRTDKKTSRQSGKFLSVACHSHIFQQSQTSKPQTRVNSDPSEPSVGLFIKMMRLAWQLGC